MLFAAGFGTRMGALSADRPKPLIPVAGRPLIDHALALADGAGIGRIVANLHYRGDQIRAHLSGRGVLFSDEQPEILETGGGLRAALPLLGAGPVYTLNTDAVWTGDNPLETLGNAWDNGMDALLLLAPVAQTRGHGPKGDFTLHPDGRITRGGDMVYLGAQILDPSGLAAIPDRVFSLNRLWDRMIAGGRAFGALHAGLWCDVGRPEGIAEAEAMLREGGDD
ncbi:nucleotidyltransferase family protein [Gemmobacter sp.]|uniref:nucleotidyltransferase family protein n=1 Tax=Gemmobacter sp. TaxID=1898957 RepID=UPI002AFE9D2D|nr:nucleotidyltransferase family protein [Gemmobacter sp.]